MATAMPNVLEIKSQDVPEKELVELDVIAEEIGLSTPLGIFLGHMAQRLRDGHDLVVFPS